MSDPISLRRDLESQVIVKAWKDPGFLKELRTHPEAALERALGIELPSGVKVHVHQEDEKSLHLVLPQGPGAPAERISEADLQRTAGVRVPGTVLCATALPCGSPCGTGCSFICTQKV